MQSTLQNLKAEPTVSPKLRVTAHMAVEDLPMLLSVEEARCWLACGRGSVYTMVRKGRLGSVRIGGGIRIPRQALAALLAQSNTKRDD